MSKIQFSQTQGGNDLTTSFAQATGLTADGKVGWQINAIECYWLNGESAAAADWEVAGILATESNAVNFNVPDEIVRLAWGLQNTGGVAVAVPYDPVKRLVMIEPRITVQPNLYGVVFSSGTSQANQIQFSIYYDVVKLSDLEVLRLLAGGA